MRIQAVRLINVMRQQKEIRRIHVNLIQLSQVRNCLEGNTISNPVHTSETRMCGDSAIILNTAWRAVHSERSCVEKPIRYSLPG